MSVEGRSPFPSWVLILVLLVASGGFAVAQTRQQVPKIGELWAGTEVDAKPFRGPYIEGMRELGWVDGQTAHFIVRYDAGDADRYAPLARELIALGVDVLVVIDRALPAAREATSTLPIVDIESWDPIAQGITSSLAKPGGNITGVSWDSIQTAVKRLELAKELMPGLRRVALLTDANDTGAVIETNGLSARAPSVGVRLRTFAAQDPKELPALLAAIKKHRPELLIVSSNTFTVQHLDKIVEFALSARLPTISEASSYAEAGLLLTYGPDVPSLYKRGAVQVDKILRGIRPAEIPFELPTRFELVVNLKTARTLRLSIPESIRVRTTKFIQ